MLKIYLASNFHTLKIIFNFFVNDSIERDKKHEAARVRYHIHAVDSVRK